MSQEWKMVPLVPTKEMLNRTPMHPDLARSLYSALLADSPTPAGAEPVGHVFIMEALVPGGSVRYHAEFYIPLLAGAKLYLQPPTEEFIRLKAEIAALQQRLTIAEERAEMLQNTFSPESPWGDL